MKKTTKPSKAPTEQGVCSMLGLCAKQGAVKSGEFMADSAIKEGKAKLVIVSSDASDNTKKGFKDACEYYHVPLRIWSDRYKLGRSIGKEFRVSLAVTNQGLADKIREMIDALSTGTAADGAGGN